MELHLTLAINCINPTVTRQMQQCWIWMQIPKQYQVIGLQAELNVLAKYKHNPVPW